MKKSHFPFFPFGRQLTALLLALGVLLGASGCGGVPSSSETGDLPTLEYTVIDSESDDTSGSDGEAESGAVGESTVDSSEGGSGGESSDGSAEEGELTLHFIDVGQALSVLVECDGQYMLYDGGNVGDSQRIVAVLQRLGVEDLQYVFCSHAHEDHVGGLAAALATVPTEAVYAPVTDNSTKCFQNFVKYTKQQGLEVEVPTVGQTWTLGSTEIELLGPVKTYKDTNNTSLVLRLTFDGVVCLLTGDMEADAEQDLIASGADLKADVLQVGHHGSDTSTSDAFLDAVMPEIAVISVGKKNSYGHPAEETLTKLENEGAEVYRTDLLGDVDIVIGGDKKVSAETGEHADHYVEE